jgi:acetyl-CoA carboxylase biotin carboxyl carrier protein
MDLNLIKKLIKIVNATDNITDLEVEEEGLRVKIGKNLYSNQNENHQFMTPANVTMQQVPAPAQTPATAAEEKKDEAKADNVHEIKSPIVGTFYRAPAPDADAYVQVGDSVSSGAVLCIVEAMKLMNEIESDASGKVVKILVENGKPVEYNQPLFLIQTS